MAWNGHSCTITVQTLRQIFPPFSARISGGFAHVEAPGEERENY